MAGDCRRTQRIPLRLYDLTDMDKNCIIHTLANGMRAVYCQRHGNVAYCGVAVNAGSRDEGVDRGLRTLWSIPYSKARRDAALGTYSTEWSLSAASSTPTRRRRRRSFTRCFQRGICREPWNLLPTLCKTLCFPSMSWKRRGGGAGRDSVIPRHAVGGRLRRL